MPVVRTTFLSSELSRNAPQVFDAAEDHPVEVTRRDGEDMVLMTRREADARGQLLQLAAQLIAVATDDRGTLGERMAERFPWMFALSLEERETCAKDLLESARASFATGEAHLAAAQMIAWEETATALAAGLDAAPVTWLPEPVTVERP